MWYYDEKPYGRKPDIGWSVIEADQRKEYCI